MIQQLHLTLMGTMSWFFCIFKRQLVRVLRNFLSTTWTLLVPACATKQSNVASAIGHVRAKNFGYFLDTLPVGNVDSMLIGLNCLTVSSVQWTTLKVGRECWNLSFGLNLDEHRVRRYFYTTFLREPTERFISEYRHVERGANWLRSKHICNSRIPTPDELPLCFDPDFGWENGKNWKVYIEYVTCFQLH